MSVIEMYTINILLLHIFFNYLFYSDTLEKKT